MKMISRLPKRSLPRSGGIPLPVFAGILVVITICVAASTTMVVTRAQSNTAKAIVRHGLFVDGRIEGSVQQLIGEDTTLNDGSVITGDLLTPGTPSVHQNDSPSLGGVTLGNGSEQPADYEITLNGNSQLGQLVKRIDAVTMPTVAPPPTTTGTRDVTLSAENQNAGDFVTIRDLTLNGGGMLTVPAGTYRALTANSGGGFVLGVAGASQPSVYNLESLRVNDGSQLVVVGPVVITAASSVVLNGPVGVESNPSWLTLKVAAGDVTLNADGALYGIVTAPSATLVINGNGSLVGNTVCDRLVVNRGGLLRIVQ